jgi:hypothetical protein
VKLYSVLAGVAGAAILATAAAGAAPQARWIEVPTARTHHSTVLLSASRVWFLRPTSTGGYTATSARQAGARLVGWKTVSVGLGRGSWALIRGFDGDLRFANSARTADVAAVAVRLLASGEVGTPVALGGAPPRRSSTGSEAVQLPDRVVRLTGVTSSGNQFVPVLAVCCDPGGKIVGLGSLPASTGALALLGVDRSGRLWLAWASGRAGPRSEARMVELDPTTLRPRGQPRAAPGYRGFVKIRALVCTDVCRVVIEGGLGRRLSRGSWAPSERAVTTIRLPQRLRCQFGSCGGVIDARDDEGRISFAYYADASQTGYTIGTARSDSRGRNLRRVASIRLPARLGSFERGVSLDSTPAGGLSSEGFAAYAFYSSGRRSVVRVALLRVR